MVPWVQGMCPGIWRWHKLPGLPGSSWQNSERWQNLAAIFTRLLYVELFARKVQEKASCQSVCLCSFTAAARGWLAAEYLLKLATYSAVVGKQLLRKLKFTLNRWTARATYTNFYLSGLPKASVRHANLYIEKKKKQFSPQLIAPSCMYEGVDHGVRNTLSPLHSSHPPEPVS